MRRRYAPKLVTVVAGMCADADCIDDIDVLRSGAMMTLFDGVHAPSTVATLLREFTFGHARQLESVLREHLVALCGRVDLLPGADEQNSTMPSSVGPRPDGHARGTRRPISITSGESRTRCGLRGRAREPARSAARRRQGNAG